LFLLYKYEIGSCPPRRSKSPHFYISINILGYFPSMMGCLVDLVCPILADRR